MSIESDVNVAKVLDFTHRDLLVIEPSYASRLLEIIIELDHLRTRVLGGTIPPYYFFQLKALMQQWESLASARIEGNNTTMAELVENNISGNKNSDEKIREILNIEKAMSFIEERILPNGTISQNDFLEVHRIVTQNLPVGPDHGGSTNPGQYRTIPVIVKNQKTGEIRHVPPMALQINEYTNELFILINENRKKQFDLLITALAHHRLVWIHPYDNGNGRVVRLLTYAMLIKQGFNVVAGRIINPTAVFCNDRDEYYKYLAKADTGTKEGLLEWCEYVLEGLLREIKKIDQLADRGFVIQNIFIPTLDHALSKKNIDEHEYKLMRSCIDKKDMLIVAADVSGILPGATAIQKTRMLKKLREKKMISPIDEGKRKYYVNFSESELLRGAVKTLQEQGFIPFDT